MKNKRLFVVIVALLVLIPLAAFLLSALESAFFFSATADQAMYVTALYGFITLSTYVLLILGAIYIRDNYRTWLRNREEKGDNHG